MKIVGINGFKRAGKGEVAKALSAQYDGVVYEVGFADKLKILGAKVLGVSKRDPREDIALMDEFKINGGIDVWISPDGPARPDSEISGREFLQNLGNEARNVLGDTLWIDLVLPADLGPGGLDSMYPDVDVLAITDLRYPNEAQRVQDLGGVIWEVIRPGLESDGHASEQKLDSVLVDWQIMNEGSLGDLAEEVSQAIQETL